MASKESAEVEKKSSLSEAELARIERNRQKAIQIKKSKLTAHPYAKADIDVSGKKTINVQGTKYVDSGAGFLIEQSKNADGADNAEAKKPIDEAIAIPIVYDKCEECDEQFAESFLLKKFGLSVCDRCHDSDDKHSLITRTEAKTEYLLKDCDLDKREPILKFICRKNPHNVRWGEMKLYLHVQIEKRALEVWESEEKLIAERQIRDEKRDRMKHTKYKKNLKQLRMEMRSSLYDRTTTSAMHEHEYGEETYDEASDMYTHVCKTCAFSESYEKM